MKKIIILNINLIGGRTWAARLCEIISKSLDKDQFKYHTLVWYNFWNDGGNSAVYKASESYLYRQLRYKLAVGLNFLFDRMTPWHINMNYLQGLKYYKEAEIIHLHGIQWWYFDWEILPLISKEKKVIMTLHDDRIISWNDKNNLFFPYKTKRSYIKRKKYLSNSIIHYIWVSDWMTNKVGYDDILWKNMIKTIYNGIDTRAFHKKDKADARKILWLPFDKKIILSIAWSGSKSNLKWLQYVYKIKELYKTNKDYLFITIGNSRTKKISNNFREIWWIDQNTICDYFNAADVFLYPTLADSFGLVVAESIACGCPVVTFQTWWVPEIVKHKQDWYVANYKDYADLCTWFERVLRNGLSPQLDTKFTQENMVKEYSELYLSLIK